MAENLGTVGRGTAGKGFEERVAAALASLDPEATVQHDEILDGRSGQRRQCDVTVRKTVAGCPVLLVVECKAHRRPLAINAVDSFKSFLHDVRASDGLLVSLSGFTAGARKAALEAGITLRTLRDAKHGDWAGIIGKRSWLPWVVAAPVDFRVSVKVVGENELMSIDLDSWLLHPGTGEECTCRALFLTAFRQCQPYESLGRVTCTAELGANTELRTPAGLTLRATEIEASARLEARMYHFPADFAMGTVLSDESGRHVYSEIATTGIDWAKFVETHEGVLLVDCNG